MTDNNDDIQPLRKKCCELPQDLETRLETLSDVLDEINKMCDSINAEIQLMRDDDESNKSED